MDHLLKDLILHFGCFLRRWCLCHGVFGSVGMPILFCRLNLCCSIRIGCNFCLRQTIDLFGWIFYHTTRICILSCLQVFSRLCFVDWNLNLYLGIVLWCLGFPCILYRSFLLCSGLICDMHLLCGYFFVVSIFLVFLVFYCIFCCCIFFRDKILWYFLIILSSFVVSKLVIFSPLLRVASVRMPKSIPKVFPVFFIGRFSVSMLKTA